MAALVGSTIVARFQQPGAAPGHPWSAPMVLTDENGQALQVDDTDFHFTAAESPQQPWVLHATPSGGGESAVYASAQEPDVSGWTWKRVA